MFTPFCWAPDSASSPRQTFAYRARVSEAEGNCCGQFGKGTLLDQGAGSNVFIFLEL